MKTSHWFSRIQPGIGPMMALLLLHLSACSKEPPVLTIGDVEYTETDLLGFNGDRRTRLAEITAFGIAVARGEASSLGDPLVSRQSQVLLLEAMEREIALQLAGVNEESLEARYQASPDYELSVRHLVLLVEEWASDEEGEEARAEAEAALARILGGEDFAQVAGEVSQEPGALERGGLLTPGRRGSWVEEFWNSASGLEVGEVSPVIRTQFGFHVLKLENRTPVPFPEARHRVVVEVARLLPGQGEAIQAWTDSVAVSLHVDSVAITTAWEEAGSLFILATKTLLERDSQGILARWDGGGLTWAEFRAFLLSLQRPSWEHVREGGLAEVIRMAREAARRALLTGVADSMGIALPTEMEGSFRTEWDNTTTGWAMALGFQKGLSSDQVKTLALSAVASTAQGIRIARRELLGWAPLLLSAYPIGPEVD